MDILTKKEFTTMAGMHESRCVSIFLPTHRGGQEVINRQDQLVFKNLLSDIGEDMVKRGFSEKETENFMAPAKELQQNEPFWRNQADGLAVYITNDFLKTFSLPSSFEPYYYLSHEFYLKPLLPYLMEKVEFYLLSLSLHEAKFFHGNNEGMEEVGLSESLPQRIEEVVGFDYRQKFVGYQAQKAGGHQQAVFHGHADWQEDKKDEIMAYFRAIDKILSEELEGRELPLVVASLDHLFPLYEEANTYTHLFKDHLSGNPERVKPAELHRQALDLLKVGFEKEKTEKKALFNELHGAKRTSTDLRDIIPSALGGRVDTLFIDKKLEAWGIYDKASASITLSEKQHLSNTSLVNLAAISVFENGGKVYVVDADDLPFPEPQINALYRY